MEKLSQDEAHHRHSASAQGIFWVPAGLAGAGAWRRKEGILPAWEHSVWRGRLWVMGPRGQLGSLPGGQGAREGFLRGPAQARSQGAFFMPLFSDVGWKPGGGTR